MSNERTVELAGIHLDALTEAEVIERVVGGMRRGQGGWLVNPNTDVLRIASRQREVLELVGDADLVVADGMPLVWAGRLRGSPLPERIAGATLIHSLTAEAARAGISIFLLGGAPGVARQAAETLVESCPGLRSGWHCPPFGFERDEFERAAITQAIRNFGPAIVFCGLGFPKQERLMRELHLEFPESWFIGSGAAIGFAAGHQRRAPRWLQRSGLEWAHRLVKEPRRLYRRYLIDDIPFALSLLAGSVRQHPILNSVHPSGSGAFVALPGRGIPHGAGLREPVDHDENHNPRPHRG